ncbi:MAG: hypothetical protein ACJA1A_000218 [Saprospiraceae bacterium]|jgi:hypothetical protein|tara:strand:+ start:1232 stop:1774 length:543 start_codon:yes stop_codon:yes gene_type:complete
MDIEKLRYPIGKFSPGEIKTDEIEKWIEDITNLPVQLSKLIIKDVDEEALNYTYRPEGWNIRQLVHHLADSHMNAFIRFKLALTEENPTIKPYLEDKWATMNDVKKVPIESSLLILIGVHERLASVLGDMSVQEFSRKYTHPEHGKSLDLAYTAGMYSWHGRHHLEHIKSALKFRRANWN